MKYTPSTLVLLFFTVLSLCAAAPATPESYHELHERLATLPQVQKADKTPPQDYTPKVIGPYEKDTLKCDRRTHKCSGEIVV